MAETVATTEPVSIVALPTMILTTKLYIPPVRPNLVARPRLTARLNNALQMGHKLTLLSTAPGFGKTALLSEWIYQKQNGDWDEPETERFSFPLEPSQVAWLSLDEDDNNPHRFLAYCMAALQSIQPGVGQATLAMLQSANLQFMTADMFVTTLINEVAPIAKPFVFVLDDYHIIKNQLIHDSLAFLLNNMPPQVHLVIAGRTAPPFSLARLRSRGQLTELGTVDLRFTPEEAAAFLNQAMGLNLSAEEISALESRTEGWIAGLQMAALAMQASVSTPGFKDTTSFVKAFTGSHRHILDYLLEEVLQRQPEHIQDFLLKTSILNRLTGPLCDAVTGFTANLEASSTISGEADAVKGQKMLAQLEQANLFMVPLDDERCWYRYHHLFADLLRHRLKQETSPDAERSEMADLHRRASAWYEENGFPVEAMGHAMAAVDVERVIRLAKQKAATLLSRSELVTLLSWLDTLPRALERSRPRLLLIQAWAMLLTGEFQAVETHLEEAEQELKPDYVVSEQTSPVEKQADILGEIATLRGGVAYFERDMSRSIVLCQEALKHLSPDNLFLRGIVLQCLGSAYSWCGDVTEATRAFDQASDISQRTGNRLVTLIAMWNLAQLQAEQGHLHQSAEVYRQTLDLVNQQPEADKKPLLPFVGRLYTGLATLMYQWNDLAQATKYATDGIKLGEQEQESSTLTGGYLILAHLKQAQGDNDGTLETLQKARHFAQRYGGPRYLFTQVATYQARVWLAQGNLSAVASWVHEQNLSLSPLPTPIPYLRETEYLVLVRLLLAQWQQQAGEPLLSIDSPLATALNILEQILTSAQESRRTDRLIEVFVLRALTLQAQGKTKDALPALQDAFALAEPEGYIRLFVDEGPMMADLLRQANTKKIAPKYVPKLLAVFNQSGPSPTPQSDMLLDPLSERELEILRLIATGMSNRELAEELVVTVGTAKWHLNNIYSKLAVRSRTQAVARARELGLL